MVPADADLRIKLPVFEGPLDLLLFLIRKNELDIYDIPIATVTKQYIQVLRSMQQLDLEIAGEFFVMAASLMEIKSRMLLPRGQAATGAGEDDDPLDPRWELVHQLLQYKKFKEAAAKLDELAAFQRDMLSRHVVEVAVTENERPLKPVDRIELWNAFNLVLRRLSEKLVVGEIKGEEVTVSDKMEELLKLIETRQKFLFTDLFEGKPVTVRLLVATFIAVLELTRLKKLRVRQDEAYADIHVEAVENTVNADGTLAEGQLNFAPAAPEQASAAAFASSPAPAPEAPALVLTASGYAEIPRVLGADAAESDTSYAPTPTPDTIASVAVALQDPLAAPTPSPDVVSPAHETATVEAPPEPAASAALASSDPLSAPAPNETASDHPDTFADAPVPASTDLAASSPALTPAIPPSAPAELSPLATAAPATAAEPLSSEKPLDTEPPRDTLAS